MTPEDIILCLMDYESTIAQLREERSWLLKQHEEATEHQMTVDIELKRLKEDNQWLEQNRSEMHEELTRLRAQISGLIPGPTPERTGGSVSSTPLTSPSPTTGRP